MAAYPPFMNATGTIERVFKRIAEAQKPERFTQDFLSTVLKAPGGSARPIIPLLKRLSFLSGDGTPTQIYARFRNPSERAPAMLEALKTGYGVIFSRNEFAHHLDKTKLRDLVVEITGLEREHQTVRSIVATFLALIAAGGVLPSTVVGGASPPLEGANKDSAEVKASLNLGQGGRDTESEAYSGTDRHKLNLSYTINLNLPASSDPEVFNAIFKSLREHLLGR